MPAFGNILSSDEIQAVAQYVFENFGAVGNVPQGGTLYRLNCAGCHGATGRGGALILREGNAPSLVGVPGAGILAAIRLGPATMPVFDEQIISAQDAASIVLYVQDVIQAPSHPGGLGLHYLGPTSEGFIAIVVGLGVVVLATVWIELGGTG